MTQNTKAVWVYLKKIEKEHKCDFSQVSTGEYVTYSQENQEAKYYLQP